jgi:protein-tyrosine phosphatase
MNPIQLRHNLWLSDIEGVSECDTGRFDTVVSVCQDCRRENVGSEYLHFPLADDMRSFESYGGSVNYETFYAVAQTVQERIRNECVLVHCHAGRNRSVAVCAAVTANKYVVPVDEALWNISNLRPEAELSPLMEGFAKQYVEDT